MVPYDLWLNCLIRILCHSNATFVMTLLGLEQKCSMKVLSWGTKRWECGNNATLACLKIFFKDDWRIWLYHYCKNVQTLNKRSGHIFVLDYILHNKYSHDTIYNGQHFISVEPLGVMFLILFLCTYVYAEKDLSDCNQILSTLKSIMSIVWHKCQMWALIWIQHKSDGFCC